MSNRQMVTNSSHPNRTPFDALFGNARQGTGEAVGQLLESYRGYLRILATTQINRRLRQRLSPSDVVQETMLAAHRDFPEFRGDNQAQFAAWLRTILARNLLRAIEQHVKTGKRDLRREISLEAITQGVHSSSCAIGGLLEASTPAPSAIVSGEEESVRVFDLLSQLPDDYREVITLRNLQSMRFEAVAEEMGRTSTAVRMLWLRAIRKLRELYDAGEPS